MRGRVALAARARVAMSRSSMRAVLASEAVTRSNRGGAPGELDVAASDDDRAARRRSRVFATVRSSRGMGLMRSGWSHGAKAIVARDRASCSDVDDRSEGEGGLCGRGRGRMAMAD